MELYEAMIIISPELEKEEHEEVLQGLSATISKNEGTVDTILDWRKRRLAYEVDKKYQEGHYYLVYFSGKGNTIPEIEHFFRVTDNIVRYMIVRTDEQEFEAAAKKAASEAAAAENAASEETEAKTEAAENAASEETEAKTEAAENAASEETEAKTEAAETFEEPDKSEQDETPPEIESTEDQAGEEKAAGE